MSISPNIFKHVMRRWVSGVAVVTTRVGDDLHGLTVSGFGGISLEPALVLISIGHNQSSLEKLRSGGVYAVSFLHAGQAEVSDRFAGRQGDSVDRFAGLAHHVASTGAPILDDCLAWFDCRLVAEHIVGDHSLLIGEVLAGEVVRDAAPLVYYNTGYPKLNETPSPEAVAAGKR